jgi:hypothetical protein
MQASNALSDCSRKAYNKKFYNRKGLSLQLPFIFSFLRFSALYFLAGIYSEALIDSRDETKKGGYEPDRLLVSGMSWGFGADVHRVSMSAQLGEFRFLLGRKPVWKSFEFYRNSLPASPAQKIGQAFGDS